MNSPQDPQDQQYGAGPDARAGGPEDSAELFIVNLCAWPGPNVPDPPPAEFDGLRAFVSRRIKDGNERFYLHAGFFETLVEAEAWLYDARSKYPNAFVSQLADTLRPPEQGATAVADTQALKVLEVRGPRREGEGDTGSYAVQSESRVIGAPSATPAWPMRPPVAKTPPAAQPPAKAAAPKPLSAADAWNAFVTEVNNDSTSTSGVRHLRVEFQRKRNRSVKPSKTPRK